MSDRLLRWSERPGLFRIWLALFCGATLSLWAMQPLPATAQAGQHQGDAIQTTCTRKLQPPGGGGEPWPLTEWTDPAWWSCGFVPGPNDTVIIPDIPGAFPEPDFPPHVRLNGPVTLKELIVQGGRIEGAHDITVTQTMTWTGGDIHYANAAPFFVNAAINIPGGATLVVAIDSTNGSAPLPRSDGRVVNRGAILWQPGVGSFGSWTLHELHSSGAFTIRAGRAGSNFPVDLLNGTVINTGTITLDAPVTGAVSLSVRNHGVVNLNRGALFGPIEQHAGAIHLAGGALSDLAATITLHGGVLDGNGAIAGSVNNLSATINPTGTVQISGNYVQGAAATVQIDLGPGGADAIHAGLGQFANPSSIGGALAVILAPGFTPDPDAGYRIFSSGAATYSGTFATVTGGLPVFYKPAAILLNAENERQFLAYLSLVGK